jgi:hypothetical protein
MAKVANEPAISTIIEALFIFASFYQGAVAFLLPERQRRVFVEHRLHLCPRELNGRPAI